MASITGPLKDVTSPIYDLVILLFVQETIHLLSKYRIEMFLNKTFDLSLFFCFFTFKGSKFCADSVGHKMIMRYLFFKQVFRLNRKKY